jgi:hypothetical protein
MFGGNYYYLGSLVLFSSCDLILNRPSANPMVGGIRINLNHDAAFDARSIIAPDMEIYFAHYRVSATGPVTLMYGPTEFQGNQSINITGLYRG